MGLEARCSALQGLNSQHLSHIVPVFSFTLGLKTKVKEKGKAGSSCFRASPGWGGRWETQAQLASLVGGKPLPYLWFPPHSGVLDGMGAGWGPKGEAPGCSQAVAFWPGPLLSGRQPVQRVPGKVSFTGVWPQVGSYCLLNSGPSGAELSWSWACVGLGKKSWPSEFSLHRTVPLSLKVRSGALAPP